MNNIDIIYELIEANGANKKKAVLEKYKENDYFKKILYYALNPLLTYKISYDMIFDACEKIGYNYPIDYKDIFDICETFSILKGVSAEDINVAARVINTYDSERERQIYMKLLGKKLRLGVTAKTVNKVIPDLIPLWEIQQAYTVEKYPVPEGEEFWLTQKLNGTRATFINGKLRARSGAEYVGLDHITDELSKAFNVKWVLDGELTLKNKNGLSDNEAFRVATGIINSESEHKPEIQYTIFDIVPLDDFNSNNPSILYKERREILDSIPVGDNYNVLPCLYYGKNQNKIWELLDKMVIEDKEGLMINLNVPYKRMRHRGILKVKRFYTMDLPIVDVLSGGVGRFENTLGSLVVDFDGSRVRVGSGLSDDIRDEIWMHKDKYLGKLCEVKYKEISYDNNTGEKSLQFPIFQRIRDDKSEISYY